MLKQNHNRIGPLRIALALWALHALVSIGVIVHEWQSHAKEPGHALVAPLLQVTRDLVHSGRSRELMTVLEEAQKAGSLDFAELRSEERVLLSFGSNPIPPEIWGAQGVEEVVDRSNFAFARVESANLRLYIGRGYGSWESALRLWNRHFIFILNDVLFSFIGCLLFGLYVGAHRNSHRHHHHGVAPPTSKRLTPAKFAAIAGAATVVKDVPQEAKGTAGRTTLLSFNKFYGDLDTEAFLSLVWEFHAHVRSIVERYEGTVISARGEEVTYFFSAEKTDADLCAVAAAFHLQEWTRKDTNIPLFTALAYGSVRGVGSEWTGPPLTETRTATRLAGKDGMAVVTKEIAERGKSFVKCRPLQQGEKSESSQLFQLAEVRSLELNLQAAKEKKPNSIHLYRSDESLATILGSLHKGEKWDLDAFLAITTELRKVSCKTASGVVFSAYYEFLKHALEERDSYRLSAALALASHLIPRGQVNRETEKLFLEALKIQDRRIKANAIELFIYFFPERETPELRPFLKDIDNRVSANAMVKCALERFDEKIVRKMEERLRSGSVAHVASAIYAMGEIAAYYKVTDPFYLKTKVSFLRLLQELPVWAQHPNSMIRRQSLVAAKKFQDADLDRQLWKIFQETKDAELRELFAFVYDWRETEQQKKAS